MRNYREDIKVDLNALEEEWEKQTILYDHYATLEVEADEEKDKAERRLEIAKAEMDERVRNAPKTYGLEENPKETAIKGAVARSKEVDAAEKGFHAAKKKAALAKVATRAIAEQKKRALTKASDLFAAGYYAKKVPTKTKEAMAERRGEEHRKAVSGNERMKKIQRRTE